MLLLLGKGANASLLCEGEKRERSICSFAQKRKHFLPRETRESELERENSKKKRPFLNSFFFRKKDIGRAVRVKWKKLQDALAFLERKTKTFALLIRISVFR